jgi:phosphate transport system substrate-binding protein
VNDSEVRNRGGQRPGEVNYDESFQSAAASADWTSGQDLNSVMTDAPGDKAYPMTATVFVLMYKKPK